MMQCAATEAGAQCVYRDGHIGPHLWEDVAAFLKATRRNPPKWTWLPDADPEILLGQWERWAAENLGYMVFSTSREDAHNRLRAGLERRLK